MKFKQNIHGERLHATWCLWPSSVADPDRVTRFLELGQNSQIWMQMDKNVIFCELSQTRNPVNILSRSAIDLISQKVRSIRTFSKMLKALQYETALS